MSEFNFGNLDKRQLCIRMWSGHGESLRCRLLGRFSHTATWVHHRHQNHRCYCATGRLLDFGLTIFGVGFIAFYSRYDGKIPCGCDDVIEAREALLQEPKSTLPAGW